MAQHPRERILQATYACVARYGIAKTTVEDAAREAKISRATVYRHFPGGKDQLIRETIVWEASRFFARLTPLVEGASTLAELLEELVVFGHRAIDEHDVLQKVLQTEPELLLPQLTVGSTALVGIIKAVLLPRLAGLNLGEGVTAEQAGDHLARMLLSLIGAPGRWDLHDPDQVRRLVHQHLLAGLEAPHP